MKRFLTLLLLIALCGCSSPPEERLFGLWKGMSRDDIDGCCQIDKTAMFTQNVSILKLRAVPNPDPAFASYFAHYTRRTGVFGVNANTLPMPPSDGEAFYTQLIGHLTSRYGPPIQEQETGNIVWNQPPSPLGLFRLTVSKNTTQQGMLVVVIFYIFDNNRAYQ